MNMKVVILAGGLGTRISEESHLRPKPMIEIGGKPILWHIMKGFSVYGFNDFVICCGYRGYVIKEYFSDYFLYNSDVTFDFRNGNSMEVHSNMSEPWRVTLVDTGLTTMTGGRVKRVAHYLGEAEPFLLTYGDGVANVDLEKLLGFHKGHGRLATITAINIEQRFGVLDIGSDGQIRSFREKSDGDGNVINGGFMVMEPRVLDYIDDDSTVLERTPFERLAAESQLMAYRHDGFWQCMDTQRDKEKLEDLWTGGQAPWRIW
jgi:glucose-1-phosphate cytidylyltransferase